jgi:hypothetical protein
VEGCLARSERARRNQIGMAVRAFLRLERHCFTNGIGGFRVKMIGFPRGTIMQRFYDVCIGRCAVSRSESSLASPSR